MESLSSKKMKYSGYLFYGVLLTLTLLYFRFPSGIFREYFQTEFSKILPGCRLSIDNVSPSLPFGIKFENTQIINEQGDLWKINIDQIDVAPDILSLFSTDLKCSFIAQLYGGSARGLMDFKKGSIGNPFTAELKMEGLNMGNSSLLLNIAGHPIEGSLSGNIHFSSEGDSLWKGKGDGILQISDGIIRLSKPGLGLENIDFIQLKMEINLNNMRLNIARVDMNGGDMSVEASGTLLLNKNFSASNLNIKGNIAPYADLLRRILATEDTETILRERLKEGRIPFIIQGTIRQPSLKFI